MNDRGVYVAMQHKTTRFRKQSKRFYKSVINQCNIAFTNPVNFDYSCSYNQIWLVNIAVHNFFSSNNMRRGMVSRASCIVVAMKRCASSEFAESDDSMTDRISAAGLDW